MKSNRDTYVRKSLANLKHKSWEHYVVNRLVHRLDDPEIEFICQQHIRADGARFLSDVYFPQFDLHLEVDERGHVGKEEKDSQRSTSIHDATQHLIRRIPVHDGKVDRSLFEVNSDIEQLIGELRALKAEKVELGSFVAWSEENEDRPQDYYERGFISAEHNVFFRTKLAALRCFGFGKTFLQQGSWSVRERPGYCVWFPRLIKQGEWNNHLSADGQTITEERASGRFKGDLTAEPPYRYVFSKMDDVLGNTFFKFLGEYHLDLNASTELRRVYVLRATEVKTISPPGEYDPHIKFGGGPVNSEFSAKVASLIESGELKLTR